MNPAAPSPATGDHAARLRIRTSLDESLIVEASAGTGKTTELVRRIVAVLEAGLTTVDKIVAVTFTHKAAGELKLRLRAGLDRARSEPGTHAANLEHALAHLEEASIGTIHAYCAQLLRERPVEAGVDPAFTEMNEAEDRRLFERAFRQWMERQLDRDSPGLRRALSRLAWRDSWDTAPPMERLQWACRMLVEWRDFPAAWSRRGWDRESEIEDLTRRILQLAPRTNSAFRPVHDFATWVERAEWIQRRDHDTLESLLHRTWRELRKIKRKGMEDLLGKLDAFRQRADADLAASLREDMASFLDHYADLKRKAGKLDFLDLLILARDLARNRGDVRRYLQARYSHIFVDEFQDTDPLQAELLLLLAADDPAQRDWLASTPVAGKFFAVGDPKQSIYKFRRADVVLYQTIRDRLVARGVGLAFLSHSHRAPAPVQQFVNAAFASELTGDATAGQASYVPLEGGRDAIGGQPAVVAIPAPRPYGFRDINKVAINACLPETIAGWVEWLIKDSGWRVRDEDGELVPVAPRHVCVLFRRFLNMGQDLTRDYARGLEARGVPHVLVGSRSFHHREEVETLRSALTAVEWPGDELSVYATLRGSLFAIDDATLLRYRHEVGRLHPLAPRPDGLESSFAPVAEALQLLLELHKQRNWRPAAETVNLLLEATRAHAGFALRPSGNQVLANVNRVAGLARSFEMNGGISFRGFVEELAARAERPDSSEAPVLEEGVEGVRLMTVHAAKGLEFPVVILADMTANLAARDPDRFIDAESGLCATRLLGCAPWELLDNEFVEHQRELGEGMRVAYVASTRARDLIVAPVTGDGELRDSWLSALTKALYPAVDAKRHARPAPGCPEFGDRTVFERPPDMVVGREDPSVKPGLHRPFAGEHEVVWWDPSVLRLQAEPELGIRQEDLLADGEHSAEGIAAWQAWRQRTREVIERASRPSFDLFSPSGRHRADEHPLPGGVDYEVKLVPLDHAPGRPGGARFGSMIHGILRHVDLDGGPAAASAVVDLHARVLGATESETEAAREAVKAAIAHDLVRRAAAAERVHREWPVTLRLDGGAMMEGVIDLAFLENGVWNVVDFKTDDDLGGRLGRYTTQVKWYVHALAVLTGCPARGWLLAV